MTDFFTGAGVLLASFAVGLGVASTPSTSLSESAFPPDPGDSGIETATGESPANGGSSSSSEGGLLEDVVTVTGDAMGFDVT